MRAVLTVCSINDKRGEALGLGQPESLGTNVRARAVEVMVVDVNYGRLKAALLEDIGHGLDMGPDGLPSPVLAVAWILHADLMKLQTCLLEDVDLAAGPLLERLKGELCREDPVGHRQALGLQQLCSGLVLGRVALLVHKVARVEVVRLPGHELAAHTHAWPVVVGDHLRRGVEERLSDGGRQLRQAVDVLRALQGVCRHVVRQAQLHDHGRVEATDQAGLILGPTDLVAHAAGLLCPDLGVPARDG
mmetsp:Transcript_104561/g.253798  ORF Transcript_104561/g.253798 Transcript_104561/m.253798 type:complete len:247 (+) Transcript_104561:1252-1992(+)